MDNETRTLLALAYGAVVSLAFLVLLLFYGSLRGGIDERLELCAQENDVYQCVLIAVPKKEVTND